MQLTTDQWDNIKQDAAWWWKGQLGRPLIQVRLLGRQTDRPKPDVPYYRFTSAYDASVSAEQIVDVWDYRLSQTLFLGDAFPCVFPDFGPGVLAAFLGAELTNGNGTVWFHPSEEVNIETLELNCQPDNHWFNRIKDIVKCATERWQGAVQIAMTDLGGNLDILSTFRPGEQLMFDLFDHADKVERLNWDVHELWWRYFDALDAVARPFNPGYSTWSRIFSESSHYMLQCDVCYMLGPDMFERFVRPELEATAQKLEHAFYHLDGVGQLPHLDSLLAIDAMKGIQWIPGAGKPDVSQWPHVYRKITDAGKKIHIISSLAEDPFLIVDKIAQQTGRADNIVYHFDGDISQRDQAERMLDRWGCI